MSIKAIMVDVDGVVVVHPKKGGWSARLEQDLGLPISTLQSEFFKPHWDDIIHGRAPLRERLAPVLADIAPDLTADQLIDYWFRNDAHINDALLDELTSLRAEGLSIHLATVQEHERAHYLWHVLDFQSKFDAMHYAAELGSSKPAAEFYESIEQRSGFQAHELFFIDDKVANVEGARARGWSAELWTGEVNLRSLLSTK